MQSFANQGGGEPPSGDLVTELISARAIADRVAALGREITADFRDHADDLLLLGVLKGSFVFLADLCRAIDLPLSVDFIGAASYGDATTSSGSIKITADVTGSVAGKHVILVEDIIDTGLTAHYLLNEFAARKPASINLCTLLHKPDRTQQAVPINYLGFTVEDEFVVGYGLDMAQKFRNLPYIGCLRNR